MFDPKKYFVAGLALLVVVLLASPVLAQMTPAVTVADQAIANGKVTIESVVSDGPGWLVIHAQKDGKPGPILGYSPVASGENDNVVVEIDATAATGTLYAMLHTDAGTVGEWEFPNGPDAPVKAGEQVITPPFNVTGGLAPAGLPVTGGQVFPWTGILLVMAGGLALAAGVGVFVVRRPR